MGKLKIKIHKERIVYLVVFLLIIFFLSMKTTENVTDEQVIDKLKQHVSFEEMPVVTLITEDALQELVAKQPAIYEDVKPKVYKVELSDKLIIYDYENDEIVKEFAFQKMVLK